MLSRLGTTSLTKTPAHTATDGPGSRDARPANTGCDSFELFDCRGAGDAPSRSRPRTTPGARSGTGGPSPERLQGYGPTCLGEAVTQIAPGAALEEDPEGATRVQDGVDRPADVVLVGKLPGSGLAEALLGDGPADRARQVLVGQSVGVDIDEECEEQLAGKDDEGSHVEQPAGDRTPPGLSIGKSGASLRSQDELSVGATGKTEALGHHAHLVQVVQIVLGPWRSGEVPSESPGRALDEPLVQVAGLRERDAVGELLEEPTERRQWIVDVCRELDRVREPVDDRGEYRAPRLAAARAEPSVHPLGQDDQGEALAGEIGARFVQVPSGQLLLAALPAPRPGRELASCHRELQQLRGGG